MDPGLQRTASRCAASGERRRSKTKTAAGITADGRFNGIVDRDVTSDI
jgi:hypothetical protein